MIDFKNDLNKEQLEVVLAGDGPCLVLAGAGSGKTRAITYRVAYLLENGIDPKNILLVTFTNKAAKEMTDRVRALTDNKTDLPWAGTFHHIAYRILRRYASELGYKNNFGILDSGDSGDLFKVCLKQEGIDRKERRFPSAKVVQSIISYARNSECSLAEVLDLKYQDWSNKAEIIGRIAQDYERRKHEANVMDFDDLLTNALWLFLKSPKVREQYSQQFEYVLVDEYQDTNKIQASILKLLASCHKNILVVGDDAQSIYSFRAADIANILGFEDMYPDAKIFKMETNYRSTPDILEVANVVIDNNINQYKKSLKSLLNNFTKPEVHAFASSQEEAEFIVERILELCDEGVPLNKIAVLFRAAFHSQNLEVELTKNGVPYEYRGGVRFFERAHIKDALAYLRVYNNAEDIVAWNRVLGMQIGIGPAGVEMITNRIKNSSDNFDIQSVGLDLPARAQVGWNDFLQIWQAMRAEPSKTPSVLLRVIIKSKYNDYLENEYPDYRERLQDLGQLALFAERQDDLDKFLAEATLQEGFHEPQGVMAGSAMKNKSANYDGEKVILSTIHQAKGLEWECVFVINLSAGQFPSIRSTKENELEEERRLFYVAITRAQKYLYFTYSLAGGFGSYMQGPSMFLEEIGRALLDEHNLQGGTVFDKSVNRNSDILYISEDEEFPTKPSKITNFLKDIDEL